VRTFLRLLASLAIAAGLLALLFHWGDVSVAQVVESWEALRPEVWASALAVHFGIYLLRALRFRVLLPPASRPGLGALLSVSSAHNLAAYVLPAKTGEGTLVLYLRQVCGVAAREGLASLVVSRLLDLATLAFLLGASTLLLAQRGVLAGSWSWPLGAALGAASVTLLVLASRSDLLVRALTSVMRLLRLDATRLGGKLHAKGDEVADALRFAGREGRLLRGAALSLPLWLGVFAFYLILARGFGMGAEVGPIDATFASSWAVLANLLPINGFAGAGTQEAGWIVGFELVGVERALALSTGLGAHLVQLANVVLFGVLGHAAMALRKRV